MLLVGFIVRICHDARSSECQICVNCWNVMSGWLRLGETILLWIMQMAATHNILNELNANEGANFSGKSCEVRWDVWVVRDRVIYLMFIGPCIVVIVEEWKANLMSLAILYHFLCAQHVSDINISIFRSLRLCCWITTSVFLSSVRCVLEI